MNRNDVMRLLHDVEAMTPEDRETTYGITTEDDGSIWDSIEGKAFDSLYAWAEFTTEQEEADDSFHKFGGKQDYYDD